MYGWRARLGILVPSRVLPIEPEFYLMRPVGIIQKLEQDLGKPVISSNQACFWHTLRLAGVKEKIEGYGTLLANSS